MWYMYMLKISTAIYYIALSTTEAEYAAATEAIKEYLWVKGSLCELNELFNSIVVYYDS